jgi:hypothetical protein
MRLETFDITFNATQVSALVVLALNSAEPYPEVEIRSETVTLTPDSPLFLYRRRESVTFDWEAADEILMDRFDEAWRRLAEL